MGDETRFIILMSHYFWAWPNYLTYVGLICFFFNTLKL
ncbi:unnamed protein product [Arabidopsis halleri]